MVIGVWVVVSFFLGEKFDDRLASASKVINPPPSPAAPNPFEPIDQIDQVTMFVAELARARDAFNVEWAGFDEWQEAVLNTDRSPVIEYTPFEFVPSWTPDTPGNFQALYQNADGQVVTKNPRSVKEGDPTWSRVTGQEVFRPESLNVLVISNGNILPIGIDQPIPAGAEIVYWDDQARIQVDFGTLISGTGLRPTGIVPAAQRTPDGRSFIQKWVYVQDVEKLAETEGLGKWSISKLRNAEEDRGNRQIMYRYTVVLRRGDTSEMLDFVPPPIEHWEKQEGWLRCWQLRWGADATLRARINDLPFVLSPNGDTNTTPAEHKDGIVKLQITLGQDSKVNELPIEWVYFRQKSG
jgi:hypothetical protein